MHRCRLHVLGASGSGTTTLGRAVADAWSVPHADADDYFWVPTDPPFTTQRTPAERLALMDQMFAPRDAWVLSGAMTGWGEQIVETCSAIVFLTLDPDVRMSRLREREFRRREGGAMDDDAWRDFRDWARSYDDPSFTGRSRHQHEAWLAARSQPILRLDAARTVTELRDEVLAWEPS